MWATVTVDGEFVKPAVLARGSDVTPEIPTTIVDPSRCEAVLEHQKVVKVCLAEVAGCRDEDDVFGVLRMHTSHACLTTWYEE